MADFRKVHVLVALVLLLGLANTASAQLASGAFTCTANAAVPPTVRSEGLTELAGDIVLTCTGGTPTLPSVNLPQVNFTVFLNTAVTSRTYDSSGTSEALLLVDEPNAQSGGFPIYACGSTAGCTFPGTAITGPGGVVTAGPEPYSGASAPVARPNTFRGIVSGNQVQFIGVPVDPPGTAGQRVFRITNIRANASGVSAGPSGTPGTIQALISATGQVALPINNPTQVVGYTQQGLSFAVRTRTSQSSSPNTTTDISFAQCNSLSRTSTVNNFILQYNENFPTAFKLRASGVTSGSNTPTNQYVPGVIYSTESGFYNANGIPSTTGTLPANVGLADQATRLKAVFNNIPAGVSVYVGTYSVGNAAGTGAVLLTGAAGPTNAQTPGFTDMFAPSSPYDTNFANAGSFPGASNRAANQLTVVSGTATAVWEIVGANNLSSDSYQFFVYFAYSANAAQNTPAPGTATVTGGYAPTPGDLGVSATTAAAASQSLAIPRFIEGTQGRSIVTIYLCRTNLLFPFVTNQQGFDTGLAISNTSTDPFGTTAQNGTCTLFMYGANAPASIPTSTINSGTTYVALASTAMPNFQGYVIANCNFQFAHGFAFISDFGARNLAMGYLALIIPEPGTGSRAASDLSKSAAGSGENLAH